MTVAHVPTRAGDAGLRHQVTLVLSAEHIEAIQMIMKRDKVRQSEAVRTLLRAGIAVEVPPRTRPPRRLRSV